MNRVFGTWPTALLLANRKRVIIEGPVCDSSQVIGWHLRNMNNETITSPIHISSFAFNSSILWDPERWGRTSSVKDSNQVNSNLHIIIFCSKPSFNCYLYKRFIVNKLLSVLLNKLLHISKYV